MTDDNINRQAALNCVYGTSPNRIKGRIAELPSAQPGEDIRAMCGECDAWNQYKNYPQPQWIPCSTALPEYDGEYLVTKKSFGWNCKEYIETDIARYEKKDGWHKADQVLAWQLLPKPYRPEGENGERHDQ